MKVRFYLPEAYLPSEEKRRGWMEGRHILLEPEGKIATAQSWVFQTWAALRAAGIETELVHELPRDGILIALAGSLPAGFETPEGLFVADIVADGLPSTAAHIHLVQNSRHAGRLPGGFFIPHWPQPGLVPRDARRGEEFSRVAFFGDARNLAAELREPRWSREVAEKCGAHFEIRGEANWHDYSDVDAVIAVREFDRKGHPRKPATKLYNSWLAGVPCVGGKESALESDGNPGIDFLAAGSAREVMECIIRLANDTGMRRSLVARGRESARKFDHRATLERWRRLVMEILPEAARRLRSRPLLRRALDRGANRIGVWLDRNFR